MRELHNGIVNIRQKTGVQLERENYYDQREGKRIDELFSDYFKFRTGNDIDDETLSAFLEIVNTEPET